MFLVLAFYIYPMYVRISCIQSGKVEHLNRAARKPQDPLKGIRGNWRFRFLVGWCELISPSKECVSEAAAEGGLPMDWHSGKPSICSWCSARAMAINSLCAMPAGLTRRRGVGRGARERRGSSRILRSCLFMLTWDTAG